MIAIEINTGQLERLKTATRRAKKKFQIELSAAINATAKKTRLEIGRDVRSVIALKKAESEKPLKIVTKATPAVPSSTVSLRKTPRLGLRHFGARQDKKGVSYKIAKAGGRQRVDGAFQGPRPGLIKASWKGNAFKRTGAARLPIVQMRGVSAYGAYLKNKFSPKQVVRINAELAKQLERRINLNVLRAEGLVPR